MTGTTSIYWAAIMCHYNSTGSGRRVNKIGSVPLEECQSEEHTINRYT